MAADDVVRFQVTVPAGTPSSAPLVTPTTFRDSVVERIRWRIPPGHQGLTGWQISMRGVQVIPLAAGQFIVGDAEAGEYVMSDLPTTGDWSITGFNTGTLPHSLHVEFHIRTLRPQPTSLELFGDMDLGEIDGRYVLADD